MPDKRCSTWLREHTRDISKFNILFEENVTYGFRRNLYGLKWPALALNAGIILICLALYWKQEDLTTMSISWSQVFVVLLVAALHDAYFLLFVTRRDVIEASDQYAWQLILSSEALMGK